ncbi:predicted protein [Naegleria gruberi]|uniref:Predicted protein n=1 Tax=Naegleria gruberi TaxID=5762 RepID=D2V5Y7_NAEGR|nr:uncharacterized protein NAEGRDRAFT_46935 [Naegleria gruberi]EFC47731.1 predicted protein [Naegleria gruberi]|eukprot:XP_002680475.1 predicted protein [Naegleria gruberi strain NEG-M]
MQFCDFDEMNSVMMVSSEWFRTSLNFKFDKQFGSYGYEKDIDESNRKFKELSDLTSSLLINSLYIHGRVSDEMITIFSKSQNLINLTKLNIRDWDDKINVEPLFSGMVLKNLTELDIDRVRIGDEGFKALSKSSYIKNLTYLRAFWAGHSYLAAKYVAESENFSNLTFLDLSNLYENPVEGVRCMCQSPFLSNLKHIGLSHFANDDVMKLLEESNYLTKLETIMLDRGDFTLEPFKLFLNSNNAKNLTDLYFEYTELGVEGVKIIAECPNMINLKCLDITHAYVGDEGARYIIESKYLKNLTQLEYYPNDPYYEYYEGENFSEEMRLSIERFLTSNINRHYEQN